MNVLSKPVDRIGQWLLWGLCVVGLAGTVCAGDFETATGLTLKLDGWIRGVPEEERESEGWVFYHCPPGGYEDADARFIFIYEPQTVENEAERDAFLSVFRKLYLEEYPRATFETMSIAGIDVEVAFSIDGDGDTLYTLNLPVESRIWSIVGVQLGTKSRIPDHIRRLLTGISIPSNRPPMAASSSSAPFTADGLTAVSIAFREQAAAGFAAAVEHIQAETAFAFMLDRKVFKDNADAWSLLFGGCYILTSSPAQDHPVTCYYHPLYDAAVCVRWTLRPDRTIGINAATIITGEFRTSLDPGQSHAPRWLMDPIDPYAALSRHIRSFTRTFENRFPPQQAGGVEMPGAASPEWIETLFNQCRLQMELLVALQSHELKPVRQCLNSFRLALIARKEKLEPLLPVGNPVRSDVLTGLPLDWRSHLVPMYMMPGRSMIGIVMGTPDVPGYYITVCITKAENPSISSVGLVSSTGAKGME
ncbi:hypothetical protein JXA80_04075 [bacterium]|nr:hypothetical protein [candidate division CSSED10-310 bacterium]